jgi:transposase
MSYYTVHYRKMSSSGYWVDLLQAENLPEDGSESVELMDAEDIPVEVKGKGVKPGEKRGKYETSSEAVRARVLAAADSGDDWVTVANANGVKKSTAYAWIRKGTSAQKSRGGVVQKCVKVEAVHIEALLDMLGDNPQLTLREMAARLQVEFALVVTPQTIALHLDGRMFSVKKVHFQAETANSLHNRCLRKVYVENVMQATGAGKYLLFVDESNVNLFIRRTVGRALVGSRAVVKMPSSKGANIHMLGALTQTGMVGFTRRRGSYKAEHCNLWIRELVQGVINQGIPSNSIVVVLDNAPCHSRVEQAVVDFPGTTILRLAPYSPMLNPIESAWSVIKAKLKEKEAASLQLMLNANHNGLTQTEWRMRYLEGLIDEARPAVTNMMCMQFVNHTVTFFADAIALRDMPAGI